MKFEFGFSYDAEETTAFEVRGAEGDYGPLIECKEEHVKSRGLWAPFVDDYRSERQTWQEWCELTPEERAEITDSFDTSAAEDNWDGAEFWGPSQPFDPAIAKDWAAKWMMILDLLSDEEAKAIFPFHNEMHERESRYRSHQIRDLQKVIEQANCAIRHGVKMTMHMVIG